MVRNIFEVYYLSSVSRSVWLLIKISSNSPRTLVTPNSSLDTPISSNNNSGSNHIKGSTIISADSSVASSISLDEEEESPTKVKKKDEHHVSSFYLAQIEDFVISNDVFF